MRIAIKIFTKLAYTVGSVIHIVDIHQAILNKEIATWATRHRFRLSPPFFSDEVYHNYTVGAPPGWVQIKTPFQDTYNSDTGYYGEVWVQQKQDAGGTFLPVTNTDGTFNPNDIENVENVMGQRGFAKRRGKGLTAGRPACLNRCW
jgi:hypothetical protein